MVDSQSTCFISFAALEWKFTKTKVLADLEAYWEKCPSVGHDTFWLIPLYLPLALRWKITHGHSVIITRHFSQRPWGFKQRTQQRILAVQLWSTENICNESGRWARNSSLLWFLYTGACVRCLCVCVCVFLSVILLIKISSLIEKHLLCASWMSNSVR